MKAFHGLASILVADDDEDDRMLIQKAFDVTDFCGRLYFATNGEETLSFLRRQLPAAALLPDLLVLDLNMPRKNGYEVIHEMQADRQLASVPILILSTASPGNEPSIGSNVVGRLSKPSDFPALVELVRSLPQYCAAGKHTCEEVV